MENKSNVMVSYRDDQADELFNNVISYESKHGMLEIKSGDSTTLIPIDRIKNVGITDVEDERFSIYPDSY